MRVFVYEHLCAGGLASRDGAGSLRAEGAAMLAAVLADFAHVPGVEAVTLGNQDGADAFGRLARTADATLVIAPELDGVLEARCCWVREVGGTLLGPTPETVHLAADKWRLGRHWREQGVPTPAPRRAAEAPGPGAFPLVLKPRHGAGSQALFRVREAAAWEPALARARAEAGPDEVLWQSFVPGQPAGVAFLLGPRQQVALPPVAQRLSGDGRFRYQGGSVPLPPPLAARAVRLARRAVGALAGLHGYVGVDLVLGEAADGSDDTAIELNPRLTTSYVGLRQLAESNLMEALLRVCRGEAVADLRWRPGPVTFTADGTVAS